VGEKEPSYTIVEKVNSQPIWKSVWRLIKRLKIDLFYVPVIPLFGIYPKEYKSTYKRYNCTPILTSALFIIAKWYIYIQRSIIQL
jgi:hypothetical protein